MLSRRKLSRQPHAQDRAGQNSEGALEVVASPIPGQYNRLVEIWIAIDYPLVIKHGNGKAPINGL
jgi:hypothetical protein